MKSSRWRFRKQRTTHNKQQATANEQRLEPILVFQRGGGASESPRARTRFYIFLSVPWGGTTNNEQQAKTNDRAEQRRAKQSNTATQSKAKQSNAEQSGAKQSRATQRRAKQSEAKQSKAIS